MNKASNFVKTELLRMERARKKITLKDMALKLGFRTSASYYNIETGRTIPNIKHIIIISQILEKPPEYFFNFKVQQR